MAVGAGAGALNPTKPVTVNDMMEAIQLPGLKPDGGIAVDLDAVDDGSGNLCVVGAAGYTEVIDDIIVEITEPFMDDADAVSAALVTSTVTITVGLTPDDGTTATNIGTGAAADPDYFLAAAGVPNAKGTYSVLRGNFTSAATWAATASHVNERTFGPGALDEPIGDAAGVANTERQGACTLTYLFGNTPGAYDSGKARVYIRSHYTAVNFGPGL